jgi:CheY-like chemotaxis protein
MPEMDGYACTQHIRKIPLQDETPIYATSAEDLLKQHSALFTGFLLKPISPKQLNETISQHISTTPIVFNQESALKFAYNDREIVKTLANLFIKELPKQVQAIREFSVNHEVQKCQDLVHKIKGSCRACGAQQIEGFLDDISSLCNEKNSAGIHLKLDELLVALESYKDLQYE